MAILLRFGLFPIDFKRFYVGSFQNQPIPKEGCASIVVSTSVLAEGIDVPSCGLVLCFDAAQSPLQHLQLRGRARRALSGFTVLVGGSERGGPSLRQLQDYEQQVLEVLRQWPKRQRESRVESGKVLEIEASGARRARLKGVGSLSGV